MAKVEKVVSFKDAVLNRLNKSEVELQVESITDRIEDYKVDCSSQISMLETSEIPKCENLLKVVERELIKAQKEVEEAYFDLSNSTYEGYVHQLNRLKRIVEDKQSNIANFKHAISNSKAKVEAHKEILERLNS